MNPSLEAARATAKTQPCQQCGGLIGDENFVICSDGINGKLATFHKRCEPTDKDLQRHHGITLAPGHYGVTAKDI